jgi:hypothetical protein
VIRFEREGEERFAHWMGGESWRSRRALNPLFGEAEAGLDDDAETGVGPAPAETVAVGERGGHDGPGRARVLRRADLPPVGSRLVRRAAAGDRAATAGIRRLADAGTDLLDSPAPTAGVRPRVQHRALVVASVGPHGRARLQPPCRRLGWGQKDYVRVCRLPRHPARRRAPRVAPAACRLARPGARHAPHT